VAAFSDSLLPLLPSPPGSVLLAAAEPGPLGALVEDLAAAGHTVLTGEAETSVDAVVLLDLPNDGRQLREALGSAHRRLRDKGKLLIPAPDTGVTPQEIVIALSETGFVLLKPERGATVPVYLARKETCVVREYRDGDEEQILPMFRRSFFVDRGLARWRWEYRENPYGELKISEAFSPEGQLVAHYAGYPVRFHRTGDGGRQTFPALQIGDTMTEPAFRHLGRGPTSLLGRTVRHYYARYCEGQVAFNYGFNTGNIQRFSMSFVGARRLESLPFHVLDLAARPLKAPSPFRSRLAGYRVERIAYFDARWDSFFQRVSGAYGLLVERDARYLEWRYARCPESEYFLYAVFRRERLAGWSVFRAKEDRLRWGDALFDPRVPGAAHQLLAHVLAAPEHREIKTVETWATSRPAWWRQQVLQLGFESRPEPDDLGFVFVTFGVDPEEEFRARLYYTMGDSDLF
jgi:hypothetical protein